MLSQSSQFSSAIYTHAAFISFERRLTEIKKKREKKKKNTVTKKLRKEIHQLLNRLLPLLSKPAILQRPDTSSKQTNKHANYKIFKEGSTFTTFSGHTQRKKNFSSSRISRTIYTARSTILPFQGRQKSINVKTATK